MGYRNTYSASRITFPVTVKSGVDSASGPRLALLEPAAVALAYCLDENPVLKQVRL